METDFKDICGVTLLICILTFLCLLAMEGVKATLVNGDFYTIVMLFCLVTAWVLIVVTSVETTHRWRRDRRYRRRREREHLRQQFHNRR